MRTKFLLRATALTALVALPWVPAVTHAAEEIPTECLTNPAPTGPQGDQGPQGDPGPEGDPGLVFDDRGPSRAPHQAAETLPQCDDIDDICIVKQPGPKGPVGEKGETGDQGPDGPAGGLNILDQDGPSRAPHSLAGADPCAGITEVCEIILVGPQGPQGQPGPKGPDGEPGPPGNTSILVGPSRVPHAEAPAQQVTVEIPADCVDYLESLTAVTTTVSDVGGSGGTLPETGGSTGTLAMVAAVLLALGASVMMVRRRATV